MISLIIPCYNSAAYIAEHLKRLSSFLALHFSEFEIIAVDDGSTDATLDELTSCAAVDSHITVVAGGANKGKGAAVTSGVKASHGEVLLFTDADLPYNLDAILTFAKALESGADVVLGTRSDDGTIAGQRSHRTLLSKLFASLANIVLLEGVPDTQAGFKGFTKAAAQEIFSTITIPGFGFDVEAIVIAQKKGMHVQSLPVELVNQAPSTVRVGSHGLKMCLDLVYIFFRYRIRS